MERFFTSWATWEKLVFLLACAIVITVLLGALKLLYVHWKLRRYTRLTELEKQAEARAPAACHGLEQRNAEEIPFGIRATESGIEVEGVWVSRSNTPDSVGYQRSAKSASSHTRIVHSGSLTVESGTSCAEAYPTEKTEIGDACTKTQANEPDIEIRSERIGIPPWYTQAPKPLWKIQHAALSTSRDTLVSQSTQTSTSEDIDHTESAPPRPRSTNKDLDLMQVHRRSQAAEMGQLTPRTRKSAHVAITDFPSDHSGLLQETEVAVIALQPDIDAKLEARSTTTSQVHSAPASQPSNLPVSQIGEPSISRPEGLPTSQANAATDDYPLCGRSDRQCGCSEGRSDDPTVRSTEQPDRTHRRPEGQRSSFEVRVSPVVRGHDSGFEILRPGTFGPALPPLSHQRHKHQRRSRSHEAPRTLQKKRRKSNDSTRSSEKGRRSWAFTTAAS